MLRHNENLENKEKIKYDLYKILRMSILLSQGEVDQITLKKFKEASLNIDKMLGNNYSNKLENLFYDTNTLEEEEKRLKELVLCINDRLDKRKELVEDYKSVTNKELDDLDYISEASDLDLYEDRLGVIKDYLDNSKLISANEEDLAKLKEELIREYDLKEANELKNSKLEDNLFNTFVNILYEMEMYSSLDLSNVDKEIDSLKEEIEEAKDQKDTFVTAFDNLKDSGISGELELEYASFVENAKKNYYDVKEKEIILKLYKLIEVKESEYGNLFSKREEVKELLEERKDLRANLSINDKDLFSKVIELVKVQEEEIDVEKENVDNINILTERIKLKENRLDELQRSVNKPEILAILKEYGLIETYDHDDILVNDEEYNVKEENDDFELLSDLIEEDNEEYLTEEVIEGYQENQIKSSEVVPTMNCGLSRLKSISVMKRVADMLGVRVKKEEKIEIKEEKPIEIKQEEKVVEEVSPVVEKENDDLFWTPGEFSEMKNEMDKVDKDNIFVDNSDNKFVDNQLFEFKLPELKETEKEKEVSDDKFMWPESNMETFDINGIFPS